MAKGACPCPEGCEGAPPHSCLAALARAGVLLLPTATMQQPTCPCLSSTRAKTCVPFLPENQVLWLGVISVTSSLQTILMLLRNREKLSCSLPSYICSFRNKYPNSLNLIFCSFLLLFICLFIFKIETLPVPKISSQFVLIARSSTASKPRERGLEACTSVHI